MRKQLQNRILILDGGYGTMIQACGIQGNNDALPMENPDVIAKIHRGYLEAGADIVSTCSFGAQRISQAEYGMQGKIREMNIAAAKLAREEADRMMAITPDRPRFVAGSVGPTGKMLSMSENADDPAARSVTFDEITDAYEEQMSALIEGGVDAFLIETIFDTLNSKAALVAAERAMKKMGRRVELMLSLTISDNSGRSLSGQTIEAFIASVSHAPLLSIGLNCGLGAEALLPYLRRICEASPFYVSCHPNAGLPNALGKYVDTPFKMRSELAPFFDEGLLNIVGGCCGTTPEHIAAINEVVEKGHAKIHKVKTLDPHNLLLSGLEPLSVAALPEEDKFLKIGERCNVAGSRKFLKLINEKCYDEALEIARKQVEGGANVIDINMDDGLLDAKVEMAHFVRLIASDPEIAKLPLMLDSSRFEVIEEALKWTQGKCIVNSISLKEGEEKFLDHARVIRQFGAAVIVMAFDEEGQATTYDRKIEICGRAYRLLRENLDFPPGDIIFDPNVLTVATGMAEHFDYGIDFVRAAEWIHANLPGARVSGGLSNLSFAFRGNNYVRETMHTVFLDDAIPRGMDMAILNPSAMIPSESVPEALRLAIRGVLFTRRDEEATELLIALAEEIRLRKEAEKAQKISGATVQAPTAASAPAAATTCDERLRNALKTGNGSTLKPDLEEAMTKYGSALKIIEGPLMEGMNEVGQLFGEGKMFLPQVVKTARTMKQAVSILNPYIQKSDGDAHSAGKLVIATVKGDVHDIGKNIVAVVLTCNGYSVTDLGVMVPPDDIIKTAIEEKSDVVCLSGLITPSLEEMCTVAKMMQEAGLSIPLIVGGATTSDLHTALKMAPLYPNGVVIRASDAAQNPVVVSRLLSDSRDAYIAEIKEYQQRLRDEYNNGSAEEKSPADAHSIPAPEKKEVEKSVEPPYNGEKIHELIALSEVRPLIDWRYFYHVWRVKDGSDEAKSLHEDAEELLNRLQQMPGFGINSLEAFYPAFVDADGLKIKKDKETLQLCDAWAPICCHIKADGDILGFFAATISEPFIKHIEELKKGDDNYEALLAQSLADRLVEAGNQYLAKNLSQFGWTGIRPAVGYPMWPEQSDIFKLAKVIPFDKVGISLTENGAMYPQASVAGAILK